MHMLTLAHAHGGTWAHVSNKEYDTIVFKHWSLGQYWKITRHNFIFVHAVSQAYGKGQNVWGRFGDSIQTRDSTRL